MKLLYNHNNYLSDKIGISSPDGGAVYVPWILGEFMKRGWEVYCVLDRDKELVEKYGKEAFAAFSKEKRWEIYNKIKFIGLQALSEENIEFDLIINEWRFHTKDNSKNKNEPGYSPDTEIQDNVIVNSWQNGTPLVVFDLDYQFTEEDEKRVKPWKVIEQGIKPKNNHTTIFIPIDKEELSQFQTQIPYSNKELVYIGNFYNREKDFNSKLIPYAKKNPGVVWLIGNYMKDELKEFRDQNKEIVFHERIGFDKFKEFYNRSIGIPLLATEEYKNRGHMTARIVESILFGGIPIGFNDFYGIETWLPKELIIDMNNYNNSMEEVMNYLKNLGFFQRIDLRKSLFKSIGEKHDVTKFVDTVLSGGKFGP